MENEAIAERRYPAITKTDVDGENSNPFAGGEKSDEFIGLCKLYTDTPSHIDADNIERDIRKRLDGVIDPESFISSLSSERVAYLSSREGTQMVCRYLAALRKNYVANMNAGESDMIISLLQEELLRNNFSSEELLESLRSSRTNLLSRMARYFDAKTPSRKRIYGEAVRNLMEKFDLGEEADFVLIKLDELSREQGQFLR